MKNRFYYLILIILTVIGATIRILAADYNNLWNDEWHTLRFSTQDNLNKFFVDNFSHNTSNPIYFLISYFYFSIIPPTSKLIIRFPALLFGILSIPLLFFVARWHFGNEMALTATVLLTFNFFHIHHSANARSYSLYIFLSIISLYYFIKILRTEYNPNNRVKLFLVNAIMQWTHPVSIFFIVTEYLFLYLNIIFKQKNQITIKYLLKVFWEKFFVEAIVFLAFVILKLRTLMHLIELSWVESGITNFVGVYSNMIRYSYLIPLDCWGCNFNLAKSVYYLLFIFLFSFFIIYFSKKSGTFAYTIKRNRILFYFLAAVIFLLPIIIFMLSQFKPFLVERYLSFIFIPLILLASLILSLLNKRVGYGLLILIGIIAIYSSFQSLEFNSYNPSYDELFEHLKETDGKAILAIGATSPYSSFMLEYYRENKNFDYSNVIPFENLNFSKDYNGYLYVKEWVLGFDPFRTFPYGKQVEYFENSLINNDCYLVFLEFKDIKQLPVRKIVCEK